ncbi:MAG: hypothetical protein LBH87_00595 [Coriobacteriales bacterium]|jgi:hypothetical protein|nr:hypothetical protein [Coriobacteriales bacterium]
MSKANKLIIVVISAAIILVIAVLLIPWNSILKNHPTAHELELEKQLDNYYYGKNQLGKDLSESISLEESTDADGNTLYTAVLNPKVDKIFIDMVEIYNSGPGMDPLTIENVRYDLTEGMLKSTDQWVKENPFRQFITWCNASASTPLDPKEGSNMPVPEYPDRPLKGWELVYKGKLTDADGTVHQGGELVYKDISVSKEISISNYEFFTDKDLSRDYEYAWQYNEKHPDNPVVTP